jgi:hypothetical protein
MTLRELINLIKFDVDQGSLKKAEQQIDGAIRGLDHFGKRASLLLSAPILALTGFSIKAASEAEAVGRRFDAMFGQISGQAHAFTQQYAKDLMLDEDNVQKTLATFQAMFLGMEHADAEALELSKRMQNLVGDFASFNNISQEEAAQAFTMGFAGNSRGLKQYGIILKEETGKAGTEAEKSIARLAKMEEALRKQGALGAAKRNLKEFSDGTRIFREQWSDMLESFGNLLLPIAGKILNVVNKGIIWIKGLNDSTKITVLIFAGLLAIVGPLTMGMAGLLTVVKALMIFNTFMGGLAGLRGALIFALQPQFLLLAGVIMVAVAALALFIEDVTVWVQGGDSLTGRLLGPWKTWAAGLRDVFKIATTDFDLFVKAMGIALVDGLNDAFVKFEHFVTKISDFLGKNKLGQAIKFVTGVSGVEYAAGKLGSAHGTLQSKAIYGVASDVYNRAETAVREAVNKFDIKNTITLTVPPGTPPQQAAFIKDAADKAFRFGLSTELQRLLENEGGR